MNSHVLFGAVFENSINQILFSHGTCVLNSIGFRHFYKRRWRLHFNVFKMNNSGRSSDLFTSMILFFHSNLPFLVFLQIYIILLIIVRLGIHWLPCFIHSTVSLAFLITMVLMWFSGLNINLNG